MTHALQDLADLAADASGQPPREVPALNPMALPDQLAVLLADAQDSGADPDRVAALLDELAAALGFSGPSPA